MVRIALWLTILIFFIFGCTNGEKVVDSDYKAKIIKVVDFKLSPDENKVVFSAITPVGNTDIWVVGIDGHHLKKLTFKDHSPSNHIARFFKRHRWRNFFKIDMCSPLWTKDGKIAFCQKLTKYDQWGTHVVDLKYFTINPDGTNKKSEIFKDNVLQQKRFNPMHSFKLSDLSEKHKKKIFLKDGALWTLNYKESTPKKLLQ